jgi:hypothetical protein
MCPHSCSLPVAVYKTSDGTYSWFDFGGGSQDMYNGDTQVSMDATGVAMADLNGDGNIDVVETNNVVSAFFENTTKWF